MATAVRSEVAPAAGPMVPRPFRVERRKRETRDVWTLELEPVRGDPLVIAPGQFTMVYAFGVGDVPLSISSDQAGDRLVHTVRPVGAVTRAVCACTVGSVLGVRGPFGNAWPLEEAVGADLVIVGGGIGLAPLRPVVQAALRRRGQFGEVAILYGGRTPHDILFRRELHRWRGRFDVHVDVTVDAGDQRWRGKVGVAPKLVGGARFDPTATVALVCGPEIMMRVTGFDLMERGVPADRIYVSLERNMRCALGLCGHCQLGPTMICRDGPVYRFDQAAPLLGIREL